MPDHDERERELPTATAFSDFLDANYPDLVARVAALYVAGTQGILCPVARLDEATRVLEGFTAITRDLKARFEAVLERAAPSESPFALMDRALARALLNAWLLGVWQGQLGLAAVELPRGQKEVPE